MSKRISTAVAALVVSAAFLAGCGGGSTESTEPSASAGSSAPSASAQASVDPSLMAAINVEDGSAPIPGAVDSVKQDGLSSECAAAVEPIRAIMAKYKSGLLVTSDTDNKALTDGVNSARTVCEAQSPQEWADFYAKEYFGWLNGATE